MALTAILALVCILLGLINAIIEEKILLGALEWFVLSIAFSVLPGFGLQIGGKHRA
jgi:hypothetical protein